MPIGAQQLWTEAGRACVLPRIHCEWCATEITVDQEALVLFWLESYAGTPEELEGHLFRSWFLHAACSEPFVRQRGGRFHTVPLHAYLRNLTDSLRPAGQPLARA